MNLKPYSKYKDANLPWLDKIPHTWDLIRNKQLFELRKEVVGDKCGEYDLLSLTLIGIIKRDMINPKGKFPAEFNTYQIVKEKDFVFCFFDVDETPRTIGVSQHNGMITGAYTVFKPKIPNSKFLYYYYLHLDNNKALKPVYTGLRKVIPEDRFLHTKTPLPSLEEQTQIVRYLDWKTSQVNRFIKAKKRQIELLKEQKQVIINDAVTGKIDFRTGKPYTKYKESGVEWLGMIPDFWSLISLKRIARFNPSKTETKYSLESSDPVVFLPMEKVSNDGIVDCSIKLPYWKLSNGFSYFKRGDVVIAKITPCFENGKGAYLDCLETDFGFGTTEFITIRPGNRIAGAYLRLLLSSKWFLSIGAGHMTGSAGQKRISTEFIKNFVVGLPTTKDQNLILKLVAEKVLIINNHIDKIQKEIQLLQEYQSRLIADVVTGKFDVRDIIVPDFNQEDIITDVEDTSDTEEVPDESIMDNDL